MTYTIPQLSWWVGMGVMFLLGLSVGVSLGSIRR